MARNQTGEITTNLSESTMVYRKPSSIALTRDTFWTLQAWGFLLLIIMSFFPRLFHIEEYLFLLLLVSTIVVVYKTKRSVWIPTALDVPLLLFAGWVLLTVPFAIDPLYSFGEWRKLVIQVAVFYWALLVLQRNQHRGMISKVMTAVVFATAAVCLYALQDFWARGGTWQNRSIRAGVPNSDYNWLTTYLVIAIPLIVAVTVTTRARLNQVGSACVAMIALVAQAGSYTRAGWLGMIAQGVALGVFTAWRQVITWVLGTVLFIGGTLVALSYCGYQQDTVDPWTLDARIAVWKLQIQEVVHHPLVGVGYGSKTFMKRFSGYPETEKAAGSHNAFLMIAMGSGVPAVVFFIWVIVRPVRIIVRRTNQTTDRKTWAFLLAVAVMIVGFATRNIFDYMFAGSLAYLYWLLVATALSAVQDMGELRT